MRGKFYPAKTVERLASELLARYQNRTSRPLAFPVSAEQILDSVLGDELNSPLWDSIPEPPGHTILAGLAPMQRLIVLNDTRKSLLLETAGLLNTTIAHEIGHWILHVDRTLIDQPVLPGFQYQLEFNCARGDASSWDEKNAHRFMGYLLMPSDLLAPAVNGADLASWRGLYDLREQLDVTITALKIRLEELGLVYVDRHGAFHHSREEALGQHRLL
jgi:hypothetical protein